MNCGACKRNQNGKLELATILIIKRYKFFEKNIYSMIINKDWKKLFLIIMIDSFMAAKVRIQSYPEKFLQFINKFVKYI